MTMKRGNDHAGRTRAIRQGDLASAEEGHGLLDHEAVAYKRKPRRCIPVFMNRARRLGKVQPSRWRSWAILLSVLTGGLIWVVATRLLPDSTLSPLEMPLRVISVATHSRSTWPGLCRGLASMAALDYPVPRFVNWTWNSDFYGRRDPLDFGYDRIRFEKPQERDRIEGIVQGLFGFDHFGAGNWEDHEGQPDRIVVVADAFDTVFQLRSEVLLKRYMKINREAEARTGFPQTIVFSAASECLGNTTETDQPWCYLQREVAAAAGARPSAQYLDPGFAIGPVKDLKSLFSRAQLYQRGSRGRMPLVRMMHVDAGFDVDPGQMDGESALNMVFAEQQLYRGLHRRGGPGIGSQLTKYLVGDGADLSDMPAERSRLNLVEGKNFEFKIGLDYFSDLVHIQSGIKPSTGFGFRVYNQSRPASVAAKDGCKAWTPALPRDIAQSKGPLHDISMGFMGGETEKSLPWKDVPLYTESCTGHIPAAILYCGPVDDESRRRDWDSLWLSKHAKQLLDYQGWRASAAKAEIIGGSTILGADRSLHPVVIDVLKSNVNVGDIRSIDEGRPIPWKDACGPWESEVLG